MEGIQAILKSLWYIFVPIFKKENRYIRLFFLATLLYGFGINGFFLLFNLYLKSLAFRESYIGKILAYSTYAMVIMTLPSAFLVRKVKFRPMVLTSVFFIMLGSFVSISFPDFNLIVTGRVLAGLFTAFISVITGPLIMQITKPYERERIFSVNFAVALVSGILGNIVAGQLYNLFTKIFGFAPYLGYRFSMYTLVLLGILSFIPFIKIDIKHIVESDKLHFFKIHTPLGILFLLALPQVLIGLGAGFTIPFLNYDILLILHDTMRHNKFSDYRENLYLYKEILAVFLFCICLLYTSPSPRD